MYTHEPDTNAHRALISSVHDVLHVENFAVRQCQHEAARLGGTAPADAMLAIVAHAAETPGALFSACARDGLRPLLAEGAAERWLLELRERVADLWRHGERSYRATLLELRNGLERMRVVASSAEGSGKSALAQFCAVWLTTRTVLLQRAEAELLWFARNPEKGVDQRWLGERYGRVETGPALHPLTRDTGLKGASNVGEDETSGSE